MFSWYKPTEAIAPPIPLPKTVYNNNYVNITGEPVIIMRRDNSLVSIPPSPLNFVVKVETKKREMNYDKNDFILNYYEIEESPGIPDALVCSHLNKTDCTLIVTRDVCHSWNAILCDIFWKGPLAFVENNQLYIFRAPLDTQSLETVDDLITELLK